MKNINTLKNKTKYLNTREKSYYAGVALVALMSASSPSQAMETLQEKGSKDYQISRVRCLWNLEKQSSKNKVYREVALEILEKKAIQKQADPKIRLKYIKKLGQFLKEHPEHNLNLAMMKTGKEGEETPFSKFYDDTLYQIGHSLFSDAEKAQQTLKLKIFYSQLPQELTKLDIQKQQQDINQSFNKAHLTPGVDANNLKYLKSYYFETPSNIQELEKLTTATKGTLLGGKVNFKLGLSIPEDGLVYGTSARVAYYETASNTPYSLAKYHLAELYNTPSSEAAGFYLPGSAYELYAAIVKEGAFNPQGKPLTAYPLAAYKLAKFLETGDNTFDLLPDGEQALYWHVQAAKHGHPYAQHELALYYMANQRGVEAFELLHQAAGSGYSKAQFELAEKYKAGYQDLIQKDFESARFWYHKVADQEEGEIANYPLGYAYETEKYNAIAISFYEKSKDPRAQVRLGKMYLKGKGKPKSDFLALAHFQKAATQENADGNYYLGLMQLKGQGFPEPKPEDAFKSFVFAAGKNHPKALFQLGIMKQFGITSEQSYPEAKEYYEEAVRENNVSALYHLGWLYKRGLGVEQNSAEALNLWEKAARLGHKEAAYKAGKIHLNEWIAREEKTRAEEAHFYLKKAADLNHMDAFYLLGLMYEKGVGCLEDTREALKSYDQAANSGHASALFKIGKFYESTLKPEDKIKAFESYALASIQGHVDARLALGKFYQKNNDLEEAFFCFKSLDREISPSVLKSMKQLAERGDKSALDWLQEKADEGNSQAQLSLAKILETGVKLNMETLLPQNMHKAIALFHQAASQGNRSAQRRLDDLQQAHLFQALGIKEHETRLLSKSDGKRKVLTDSINEKENTEYEKKPNLREQTERNELKTNNFIKAIFENFKEGNHTLVNFLQENFNNHLDTVEGFNKAIRLFKDDA